MNDNRISKLPGHLWPLDITMADFQAAAQPTQTAATADLFAVAWTLANRDHELNKLFNAAYYYEI